MNEGNDMHKELEDDANEDLELKDEDADQVTGGTTPDLYGLTAAGKHIQK